MTTWQVLTSLWDWEPSVLIGCAALLAVYALVVRPLTDRAALFAAGVVVMLVALISPIDTLGDRYLFSAHMLQHLLLVLVVPPLLLLGLPASAWERALQWGAARRLERVLGQPVVAWVIGVGTLWIWHAPGLYEAALYHPGLHIIQHLCFLVSATIFWWPAIAPLPGPAGARRLAPLLAVPYLATAGLASSVLGIILTFAPPGLYPFYLHPSGAAPVLALVRQGWGLSVRADQQAGGLLMWVLSTPIYLLAAMIALARWYQEDEGRVVSYEL